MPGSQFEPFKYIVYIAGPITKGDKGHNLRQALTAVNRLVKARVAPIVPQLSILWDLILPPGPDTHDLWLPLDLTFVARCHALLRLPGESVGADHEVEFAQRMDVPVFYSLDHLLDCLARRDMIEREGNND